MPSSESGSDGGVTLRERFGELRENAKGHWSTQAEATLLATLEQLHTRLMARSTQTYQSVEGLYVRTAATQVTLTNAFNHLKLLSQQHFVQHRIATEDLQLLRERQKQIEESPVSDDGEEQEESVASAASPTRFSDCHQRIKKQAVLRRMRAYVEACQETLLEEGVRVPLCPEDAEELAEENPYRRRRLCGLVGTEIFLRDAEIGCSGKRGGEADGGARAAPSPSSAQPASSADSAVPSSQPSMPAFSKTVIPTVPPQGLHKGAVSNAVAAIPVQAVSRPPAPVVPPPVKSVVPPPKPAVPPPAKATTAQRVAAKKKQRLALFSSSSSSASSSPPRTPPSSPSAPVSRNAVSDAMVRATRAPPKTTGKGLLDSSSNSESETATSFSDSSTLSSTTSEDAPPAAAKPNSEANGAASALVPPPPPPPPPLPSAKRPPVSPPVPASRSSSASTDQAAPPPPLTPAPLPASVGRAAYDSTPAGTDATKTTAAASSASAQSSSPAPPVPPPQPAASSAFPLPPLVFSLDDDAVPTAAPGAPPTAVPPVPPAPVSGLTATTLPARGGKLLSTSSEEDE